MVTIENFLVTLSVFGYVYLIRLYIRILILSKKKAAQRRVTK